MPHIGERATFLCLAAHSYYMQFSEEINMKLTAPIPLAFGF
jgi:hypothetical protein